MIVNKMPLIKQFIVTGCCAFGLAACYADTSSGDRPEPDETLSLAETTESAPEIGTFTFDEIDIRGCGMTLRAAGSDPWTDGVYLFNGLESPNGTAEATLRMKIDGDIVQFQRTSGEGEEYYGQFDRQTFASLEEGLIAEVNSEVTSRPENSEVWGVKGTITVINAEGQETSVEAIGDVGC
ncbi:hypothetical protein [Egbenema bharatensis]|uniref:hypothetical protein n=1 Tax=Egbenema bharatensis TaxID=3463334 RepID=UPI003A837A7B